MTRTLLLAFAATLAACSNSVETATPSTPDGGDLSPGVPLLTLAKTGDTTGEVRDLTANSINSRWGGAELSEADLACWSNIESEICASSL